MKQRRRPPAGPVVVATAFAVLACAIATSVATAAAPATQPGLKLTTPAGWTQKQSTPADPKAVPTITITAPAAERVRLRIQPIPLGSHVLSDEQVRKILTNMATTEMGADRSKPPTFRKIEGNANGYSETFTPAKQDPRGEQFDLTDVVVQLPGLALAVGITHRKDASLDQALDILRTATFGRPTTQPAG